MLEHTLPEGRSHRAGRGEAPAHAGAAGTTPTRPKRASARAARDPDAAPPAQPESRTLAEARLAFIAAIARDTSGTDRPRLVKVLDALIAWSVARPTALAFRTDQQRGDVLAFALTATGAVFWSAQAMRGTSPTLEIYVPAGRPRCAEDRAAARETLSAYSRTALVDGDRLRIGFGALKNEAARAAVLALMRQLLATPGAPTEPTGTAT